MTDAGQSQRGKTPIQVTRETYRERGLPSLPMLFVMRVAPVPSLFIMKISVSSPVLGREDMK